MRVLIFAFLLAFVSQTAFADGAGDQDQRYQDLKRDWLSGTDDLKTLREMAVYATEGNVPTQVLLGLIEAQPHTYHYAVKELTQEDYKAIFRKPDGRFGKRWLRVAAESDPVAALMNVWDIDNFEARAMALADAGMTVYAIKTASLLANKSDHLAVLRILSHPNLLPQTKATLHWYARTFEDGMRMTGRTQEADDLMNFRLRQPRPDFKDQLLSASAVPHIRWQDLPNESDALRLRGAALLSHPEIIPLTEILRDVCPDDTAYHLGAVFHLHPNSTLRMAMISPFEPVVSNAEWQQSGRFRSDLLRSWSYNNFRIEMLKTLSECFTQAVEAELDPT